MAIKTSRPTVVALLIFFSISIHLHAEEYRLGEIFAGYSVLHGDLQKEQAAGRFQAERTSTDGSAFTLILMHSINQRREA